MKLPLAVLAAMIVLGLAPFVGRPLDDDQAWFILTELRVPRVMLGALVGSTLALVGACYQTIFDNPLATPSTVGTTAGASLGALAALVLLPDAMRIGTPVVTLAAFAGAMVVTVLVAALAATRRARVEDVLLGGIALTLASGAMTTGLQLRADQAATFRAVRWSLGSLQTIGFADVWVVGTFAAVSTILLLRQTRALEALVGGEALAHAQGVDVIRVRTLVLGAGALGVGACVAVCGPIAFVGLVVPHVVRRLLGAERRILIPMSTIWGGAFLVACDAAARALWPETDMPVGVLTAALGAPLLIVLVARR